MIKSIFNKVKRLNKTYLITIILTIIIFLDYYLIELKVTKLCKAILQFDPSRYDNIEKCINIHFNGYNNSLSDILQILLPIFIILSIAKLISDIFYYIKNKYIKGNK